MRQASTSHPQVPRLLALCAVLALVAPAYAAFDLQVTEIWPGNEPGTSLTADWFEVTNFGDMPWVAAVDGDLYFDDDSEDPTTADPISGVASIAPGESVIFVDAGDGGVQYLTTWTPEIPLANFPQIGTYAGSGLSQGGDAVSLWISPVPPVGAPDIVQAYPNALNFGGRSYDVQLGAFSTVGNVAGAVETTDLNDAGQSAIGSPGTISPEPGSLVLMLLGAAAAGLGYRRR